jgi:hypothetical protein
MALGSISDSPARDNINAAGATTTIRSTRGKK